MATLTVNSLNDYGPLGGPANGGSTSGNASPTNPTVGAFVPQSNKGGNMNSELNQSVGSPLTFNVSDPSRWGTL